MIDTAQGSPLLRISFQKIFSTKKVCLFCVISEFLSNVIIIIFILRFFVFLQCDDIILTQLLQMTMTKGFDKLPLSH